MKKLLFLSALVIGLFACDSKDLYEERNVDPADFVMTETLKVEVKEGMGKEVYYNGNLIYDGNMSLTIDVPKLNVTTRSLGVLDVEDKGNSSFINKKGVLLFEDITNGDNDYNDFVCYIDEVIELKKNGNMPKYNVTVRPIAMGNELPLQFGAEILIDNEVWKDFLISEDVRKDFYNGNKGYEGKGYINTVKGADVIKGKTIEDKNYQANGTIKEFTHVTTNYYIVVNGVKRYACDSSKATLTDNNVPFGLFIPFVESFRYSQEFNSFFIAYPNFMNWVEGRSNEPFKNPNEALLY